MDLATELQKIYDSEINIEIGRFWDGGKDVRLGDKMNGYLAEENFSLLAEILPWLTAGARSEVGAAAARGLRAQLRLFWKLFIRRAPKRD